jgi:putative ATPase
VTVLKQEGLFSSSEKDREAQLAERMRPIRLEEFVGQRQIMAPDKLMGRLLANRQLQPLILWGPPGSGKTTLARLIAQETGAYLINVSAVTAGVREVRAAVDEADHQWARHRRRTVLFVDEIHRFNKAQQDLLLPHVESGRITFIGATTENPSFEVIAPLLSRAPVVVLEPLSEEDLEVILRRALGDDKCGLGGVKAEVDEDAVRHLAAVAKGDARLALNGLEVAVLTTPPDDKGGRHVTRQEVVDAVQKKALLYDKNGEEHYNLISALHKSLRGSDPDAALYWLARMLNAGEDPLYITRRMIRFAAEDVGLADPRALMVAIAAQQAFQTVGRPEGDLALAEAAVYLAMAPKSNALYVAYDKVNKAVEEGGSLPVPMRLRNAPTALMSRLGYGRGYRYPHDHPDAYVPESYLPEVLEKARFYEPTERGFEATLGGRLRHWRQGKESQSAKRKAHSETARSQEAEGRGRTTQHRE